MALQTLPYHHNVPVWFWSCSLTLTISQQTNSLKSWASAGTHPPPPPSTPGPLISPAYLFLLPIYPHGQPSSWAPPFFVQFQANCICADYKFALTINTMACNYIYKRCVCEMHTDNHKWCNYTLFCSTDFCLGRRGVLPTWTFVRFNA